MSAMSEQNETSLAAASAELGTSVLVYIVGVMTVGWILFELLRLYVRDETVYRTRMKSEETRNPLVEQGYTSCFGWLIPTIKASDDDILEFCGLDTLMFLRFHKICIKVHTWNSHK